MNETLTYQDPCYCRRCFLHDDPGGCIIAEQAWILCLFLAGLPLEAY